MYQILFYVPESHVELVKQALFDAGAGRVGDYDCCCWQTLGTGQFRPNQNANPNVGEHDVVNQVAEYKVELVCSDNHLKPVLQALLDSHPYETPAYSAYPIQTTNEH